MKVLHGVPCEVEAQRDFRESLCRLVGRLRGLPDLTKLEQKALDAVHGSELASAEQLAVRRSLAASELGSALGRLAARHQGVREVKAGQVLYRAAKRPSPGRAGEA